MALNIHSNSSLSLEQKVGRGIVSTFVKTKQDKKQKQKTLFFTTKKLWKIYKITDFFFPNLQENEGQDHQLRESSISQKHRNQHLLIGRRREAAWEVGKNPL